MKLKLISWILASVIITPLLVSCSKEQQEPVISTEHEQPERTLSLADLYQLMRANMAQSFEEVAKQDQLRGLDATTTAPSDAPMEITHSYQDELKSNYSNLYKQEYSKIMGSLAYDNDLPKLEDIISLNLPEEEKIRLVTALALTAEVHAAIGSNMFAPKPDSLLFEGLFSDRDHRKLLEESEIRMKFRVEEQNCADIASIALQNAVSHANDQFLDGFVSTVKQQGLTYASAGGTAAGFFSRLWGGVTFVAGLGLGIYEGYTVGNARYERALAISTAAINRNLNNCLERAHARAMKSYRQICAGVVALPNRPSTEARVTDTIPQDSEEIGKVDGTA